MKNSVTAHPEAVLHSICDVQALLEAEGFRCKIMVMSPLCYAALLKEDYNMNGKDSHVKRDVLDILKYGYLGTMWGSAIYPDRNRQSYEIDAYGDSCVELQLDHPDIWGEAQEIITQGD